MFNGYNWQTRTLEVRPDRIAPDFDTPIPIAAPAIDYLPTSAFDQRLTHSSLDFLQGGLLSAAASGLSIPTIPPALDDEHSLSRPSTASGSGSRNLFVGNVGSLPINSAFTELRQQLPFHCQWQDLKDLFRQAGTIIRADVALGPDGRSRGFGTVVFATDADAERGLKMFNGWVANISVV